MWQKKICLSNGESTMKNNNSNSNTEVKKYYWLRLHKDFFKRHDIRIVEDMDNGKDYILFYMKLLLESIDHEGRLRFSETIPYNEKMLATITNTNVDIVKNAINVFRQLKLMEIMDDQTIYMTQIEMMLGVETEWAVKKREYREKQKMLNQDTLGNGEDIVLLENHDAENNENEVEEDCEDEEEEIVEKVVKDKKPKVDYQGMFDRFWEVYPRKVGKPKCLNWFKSHKVTEEFVEEVIKAIELQKTSIEWTKVSRDTGVKGAFIPHPLTWLNRGGWNDELHYTKPISDEQKLKQRWEKFIDGKE